LEPNTAFHHDPPALPAESEIAEMAEQGQQRLEAAAYHRYEVSAFARDGLQCRHNLNYWRFGDYAGIGPGAHGKRTRADGRITRRTKRRGPADYLAASGAAAVSREWVLDADDLVIEFMLNSLRLVAGVPRSHFADTTGLPDAAIAEACAGAIERGLLHDTRERLQPTPLGLRYLNDLQALFLPD
jgi:oxygen-independent coproporphyrinogen-3 oxidase